MLKFFIFCLLAFQYSALADLTLTGPLLSTSVEVEVSTTTVIVVRGTPCFTTTAPITECRRKRGIQERAIFYPDNESSLDVVISPSQTLKVESTRAPRSLIINRPRFSSEMIMSSIDETYYDTFKFFRQIAAIAGRDGNSITIAQEGCAGPVDFSKFLSCIGLTVQQTDTVTRWFTSYTTTTSGYNTVLVAGCTPPFFPYPVCSIQ